MATPQIMLTFEVTEGNLAAITARDTEGNAYNVSLTFTRKPEGEEVDFASRDDKHKPEPGRWCCKDDNSVCFYDSQAPPCQEGSYEVITVVKTNG